jgi:hypothetical protein
MRLDDQTWQCDHCGNKLNLPEDAVPSTLVVGATGRRTYQVLMLAGVERHRCELRVDEVSLPPIEESAELWRGRRTRRRSL